MGRLLWLVMLVATVFVLGTLGARAQAGLELHGQLEASALERDEGYFALSEDTMLMVRPGSQAHAWLKAHSGQTVRLIVEPAGHETAPPANSPW